MIESLYIDRVTNHLHRLEEVGNYYNFECPFCREGNSAGRKKRAFILKDNGYSFYCHNCFASMSFQSFLYELDKSVYYQWKEDNRENKFFDQDIFLKKDTKKKKEVVITVDDHLNSLSESFTKHLYPVRKSSLAYSYLLSRKVEERVIDLLLFYYNSKESKSYNESIVFPFYNRGYKSFYGFQSRKLSNKFFHIELQENTYPKVWNLFNIDNSKPVYIFEGVFDSLVIDNSIAINGADIPTKYMNLIQKPIFVFDNDKTGFKKAIKYAEMGYDIFIYPTNFKYKDFNEMYCKTDYTKDYISGLIKDNIYGSEEATMLILDRQIR